MDKHLTPGNIKFVLIDAFGWGFGHKYRMRNFLTDTNKDNDNKMLIRWPTFHGLEISLNHSEQWRNL